MLGLEAYLGSIPSAGLTQCQSPKAKLPQGPVAHL